MSTQDVSPSLSLKRSHNQFYSPAPRIFWDELNSVLPSLVSSDDMKCVEGLRLLCSQFDIDLCDWEETCKKNAVDVEKVMKDHAVLLHKDLLVAFVIKCARASYETESPFVS